MIAPKKIVKIILRTIIVNCFFRPYHAGRMYWPFWFYILNRRPRKLYAHHQSKHSETINRAINELRKEGIAITHLENLFPGENILQELQRYAQSLLPVAKYDKDKKFLLKLWDFNDEGILDVKNPFTKVVLSDPMLAIVNGYMDMFSRFFYNSLNWTFPIPDNALPVKSQRWHRDHEDKKVCKVFLYLNDVNEGAGPFIYVRQSHYGGKWNKTFAQTPPKGTYPPFEKVEKAIPGDNIKVCTGRAGTIIFCDTMGLHRGGYAASQKRLMFTAEYASRASFVPLRYRFNGNTKELTQAARFAVSKESGVGLKILNTIARFSIHRNLY